MPAERSELEYRAEFSAEEYQRIAQGIVPKAMEDKWFVFLEGDELFFHRSWTGHCIYSIEFEERGGSHVVRRAEVNRAADQYRSLGGDAYDVELLEFLIDRKLLGKPREFPIPPGVDGGKGLYQHVVAGTGSPERPARRRPWWNFWAKS